ncbi:MAG TPA: phosphoglycerate dehydrogenase [Candidatus Brocadiia bacterium]|nr:phosphoglycerate dehydrogenase [Candidatus Brocadiia bacterium]
MKVLVADKLPADAMGVLKGAGIEIVDRPGMTKEQLLDAVKDVEGIIVRSATTITGEVLEKAERLKVVCRAGVGVDNVDVPAATKRGVIVMNTPAGNTLSTAEHAFALILAMSRNIAPADKYMKEHKWEKKKFTGTQLAGKTLAVVGLGRIGREVAARAQAFKMKVIGYDPLIGKAQAQQIGVELFGTVDELLPICDYMTVHVPLNEQTDGMIGREQFAKAKPGFRVVNCARGGVIDEEALLEALNKGQIAGAALDVYREEPPKDWRLPEHEKLVTTPHLGASTVEAQEAVAQQAAEQMVEALVNQRIINAVNLRAVAPEEMEVLEPYCVLARRMGLLAAQILGEPVSSIEVTYEGEVSKRDFNLVSRHLVMGILSGAMEEELNLVNVSVIASERGIKMRETVVDQPIDYASMVLAKVTGAAKEVEISGALISKKEGRIVRLMGFEVEALPEGHLLVVEASDRPGLIGKLGTVLGARGINIARMTFGRKQSGGRALVVLNLDTAPSEDALKELRNLADVDSVKHILIPK